MPTDKKRESCKDILDWVKKNVEDLKFGSVQITVFDGQIVQLDRTDKFKPNKL